jgi:hypothetical protein
MLVKLLPPGNRPGHEDGSVYRGGDAGIDGEAAARGATGSAHWETTHPSRYGRGQPMRILAFLRRLGRKLMPPGSRGTLETEYRQPNSMRQMADRGVRPHQPGNWAGQ